MQIYQEYWASSGSVVKHTAPDLVIQFQAHRDPLNTTLSIVEEYTSEVSHVETQGLDVLACICSRIQ